MKQLRTVLMVLLVMTFVGGLVAHAQQKQKMKPQAKLTPAAELKWVDAPPSLPGAKIAVLEGDPKKKGPFTVRFKFPADFKAPPHWHPSTERVTVLSGAVYLGLGDTFDTAKGQALSAGSYGVVPAKTPHYGWTKEETIIQLQGTGPWAITYINPADDPSKKAMR